MGFKTHEEFILVTDAAIRSSNLLWLRQKTTGFSEEDVQADY